MLTIQTKATVTPERLITLSVPAEVVPGEHQVILVIEAAPPPELAPRPPLDFPVDHYGPWPGSLSLRREDLEGDDGR